MRALSIAAEEAEADPRIRVLRHPNGENRGTSAARNLGLAEARGEFIALIDGDDVWLPWHLQTQMRVFADHPDVAMVYGMAERWFDHAAPFDPANTGGAWGENHVPPLTPPGEAAGRLAPGVLLRWFRADQGLTPCTNTVVIRAVAARAVGGFVERFRGLYDDQAFNALISSRYPVYANPVCTARYRKHAQSCCATADAGDRAPIEAEEAELIRFLERNRLAVENDNG